MLLLGVLIARRCLGSFLTYVQSLSRVSLWLSLARVYAPPHKTRRLALVLATAFGVLGTLSIIAVVLGCNGSKWGTRLRVDRCYLDTQPFSKAPLYAKLSIAVSFGKILSNFDMGKTKKFNHRSQ